MPVIIKLHWLDYALLLLLTISISLAILVSIFYPTVKVNESSSLIKYIAIFFTISLSVIFIKILISDKNFLEIDFEKIIIHDAFTKNKKVYFWDKVEKVEFSYTRYSTMNLTFKAAKPLENGQTVLIGNSKCLNGKLINARELADIIRQARNSSPQKSIKFHSIKMKFLDASY